MDMKLYTYIVHRYCLCITLVVWHRPFLFIHSKYTYLYIQEGRKVGLLPLLDSKVTTPELCSVPIVFYVNRGYSMKGSQPKDCLAKH